MRVMPEQRTSTASAPVPGSFSRHGRACDVPTRRLITVKWANGRTFNVLNVNLVRANRRHLEPAD